MSGAALLLGLALAVPPAAAPPIRFEEIGAAAGARIVHHARASNRRPRASAQPASSAAWLGTSARKYSAL